MKWPYFFQNKLENLHVDIIEGERVELVGGVEELPGRHQVAHPVLPTLQKYAAMSTEAVRIYLVFQRGEGEELFV
jgi:hypothetical protein